MGWICEALRNSIWIGSADKLVEMKVFFRCLATGSDTYTSKVSPDKIPIVNKIYIQSFSNVGIQPTAGVLQGSF